MLLTTSGCPQEQNCGGVIQHLELYIRPNGNDSSQGTKSSPLATIREALDRRNNPAVINATFHVAEGTYYITDSQYNFEDTDVYRVIPKILVPGLPPFTKRLSNIPAPISGSSAPTRGSDL